MPANGDSSGWNWIRLGDHATKIGSGFTPTGGHKSYRDSGIPLIRSQNVHMNRFAPGGLAFVSPEQDEEMAGSRVLPGDVLRNITGASIGRVCVVPPDVCPANVNQHVCIIRTDGAFSADFLAFYLATPDFQKTLRGFTGALAARSTPEFFKLDLEAQQKQLRQEHQAHKPMPRNPNCAWSRAQIRGLTQANVVQKTRLSVPSIRLLENSMGTLRSYGVNTPLRPLGSMHMVILRNL